MDASAKKKAGRPKTPPPPPALGIAERSGEGWKFTIVLGGLKVNGKKFDPQMGAEVLAGMLEDGMKRITPTARSGASPEEALEDLEAADAAESGDGDRHAANGDSDGATAERSDDGLRPAVTPELAMPPGQDGANGNH